MNRKNLANKIIMGMLAGCMMVSIGTLSFANSTVKAASSSDSTITQESKMDKVAPNESIKVILDKLVVSGIIIPHPQELEALEERQGLTPFEQFDAQLDNLVSAGTITEDVKATIVDYIKQKDDELEKVKNMSETERQTYLANKSDLASELIDSVVISQDQVNAIKQAIPTLLVPSADQEQLSEDNYYNNF